jgi:secondary thiamine-phosphate synthase enzyme
MTWQREITVQTDGHGDVRDITPEVGRLVAASGIATGTAHMFAVGSTAALGAIEFEPGLARDLPELLDRIVPPSRDYGHERAWHDGNGHSHLQATWLGPSLTVPVSGGEMVLGTWQQVILLECDTKPRRRTVVVTVAGE